MTGKNNNLLVIGAIIVIIIGIVIVSLYLGHQQPPSSTSPGSGSGTGLQLGASVSPPSAIVNVTSVVSLTASATGGVQPYYFQWYNDTGSTPTPIVGQTGATLYVNTAGAGTYKYYVSISDSETPAKTVVSSAVSVQVVVPTLTASISPQNGKTYVNQSTTFTATASHGVPPYTYQWYNDTTGTGVPISNQTKATLSITPSRTGTFEYYVSTTDSESPAKTVYSTPATLTVNSTYSVPIVVTNNQSTATPAPFQQMIILNPAQYSSHEATDLGNIRFFKGSTELYSWCESGCSAGSQHAIFWVRLPDSIAAYSTANLSMAFLSTSTNYDGVYAGEAPQLSPTYAEYDNGAEVFKFYDNFNGTTLNTSKWTAYGGSSYSVNDGLTGVMMQINTTILYNPEQYVQETYADLGNIYSSIGYSDGIIYSGSNLGDVSLGSVSGGGIGLESCWNGCNGYSSAIGTSGQYEVYSIYTTNTTPYWYLSANYGIKVNLNQYIPIPSEITSEGILISEGQSFSAKWYRIRAEPPNGVMPSVSFSAT